MAPKYLLILFRKVYNVFPQQVPRDKASSRMVKRFKETGNVHTEKPPGPVKTKTT